MDQALVLCFRRKSSEESALTRRIILAEGLVRRARSLEATLVAWHPTLIAFSMPSDRITQAVEFAISEAERGWAAGIARGIVRSVVQSEDIALSLGLGVDLAELWARAARSGDVLMDASIPEARNFASHGGITVDDGDLRRRALRLTPPQLTVPPAPAPADEEPSAVEDQAPSAASNGGGAGSADSPSQTGVPPSGELIDAELIDAELIDETADPEPRPSHHPPVTHGRPPASFRNERESGDRGLSTFASLGAASETVLSSAAVVALKSSDLESLDKLVEQLKSDQEGAVLADRLSAMSRLLRGDIGSALGLLRAAKLKAENDEEGDPCRATLALGIGLAAAGRPSEALIEALEGLSRARETKDRHGERACARFIGSLCRRAHEDEAAEAWDAVAAQ